MRTSRLKQTARGAREGAPLASQDADTSPDMVVAGRRTSAVSATIPTVVRSGAASSDAALTELCASMPEHHAILNMLEVDRGES